MIPGVAKMILISCSLSQSPNQPRLPNSSTSIRPAITGDTENGRFDDGDQQLTTGEAEAGNGPGRRDPEQQVEWDGAECDQCSKAKGTQGIRLADGVPEEGEPRRQRLNKDGRQRQQQQGGKPTETHSDQ